MMGFPKRFYVHVHGENFEFDDEGAKRKGGFYATRFVDAPSLDDAKKRVMEELWNDPSLPIRGREIVRVRIKAQRP